MNKKTLGIILGVTIILLIVIITYFYFEKKTESLFDQNENTNTSLTEEGPAQNAMINERSSESIMNKNDSISSNWKTYTNSLKGYSVEYPPNLIVDDSDLNKITIGSQVMPHINITTYQLTGNTDLQSFVQKKLIDEFGGLLTNNELEWVIIDNDFTKIGVKFPSKVGGYDGELYWVYIGHNNLVYKIAAFTDYENMTQKEFQNKIISGFKFTK